MQIMRLLIAGQIDPKTAGLLLYALQTASSNLQGTRFEPNRHEVILDPAMVGETPLGESIWEDSDSKKNEGEEDEENEEESEDKSVDSSTQPTGKEVRDQLRTQILEGFPTQIQVQARRR
jgi:hypothetical protein